MNIACEYRDRIFEDGTPAEWAGLEAHCVSCTVCAEELRIWKALGIAAQALRDYSDSSSLWPRIERALNEGMAGKKQRAKGRGWRFFGLGLSLGWQAAAGAAFVLILTVSGSWFFLHRPVQVDSHDQSLLKSQALAEVERTQTAYEHAIDKLAADAKLQLENPATPLQASYREKLLVLDSAISDLHAQAGMNPSNAQLRQQLLAMYQEKQQTLEDIVEARQ